MSNAPFQSVLRKQWVSCRMVSNPLVVCMMVSIPLGTATALSYGSNGGVHVVISDCSVLAAVWCITRSLGVIPRTFVTLPLCCFRTSGVMYFRR